MEQEPEVDFVMRSEGEETIVHLVKALETSLRLERATRVLPCAMAGSILQRPGYAGELPGQLRRVRRVDE